MPTQNLLWNPPLLNYIHYKTGDLVGELADGAIVDFFEASNHAVRQDTYSDAAGTTVNANPLVASAVGSLPPIYMQDIAYYIVITDKFGNVIETIDNAIPNGGSGGGGDVTKQDENIIANGQFTYPVDFSESEKTPGLIEQSSVVVATGWTFRQESATTTKNVVTYNSVISDDLEANPINEFQLKSSDIEAGEGLKDLVNTLGYVNAFESEALTFSFEMQNKNSGTIPVELIINKNYGVGGSDPEFLAVKTFDVAATRAKYSTTYTIPSNTGKVVGDGGSLDLILRIGIGITCTVGITNCFGLKGSISSPDYPEISYADYRARALGQAFLISESGVPYNYGYMKQVKGIYTPIPEVGKMEIFTIGKEPTEFHRCDGTTLDVKDFTVPYVSNRRLFNKIGQEYGGTGALVVTSSLSTVEFDSAVGARELSLYTAGDLGAAVTVTNTEVGLKTGVSCVLQSPNTVRCTYIEKFTQAQDDASSTTCGFTPVSLAGGNSAITSTNITLGTPAVQAVFDVNFPVTKITSYRTSTVKSSIPIPGSPLVNSNTLGWQSSTRNVSFASAFNGLPDSPTVSNLINFSVDGSMGTHHAGAEVTETIPFISTKNLLQNIQIFINTINNKFEWTVKINTVPTASKYFEYSSQATDYYLWYTVDGVGVDPAIPNKTGTNAIINSTDTTDLVAQKTATAINDLNFNLPDSATHLPLIPAGGIALLDWYISF
tara:strand:- start:3093 stop:5243 length:2151 start_codon:yes stop_codon:yes gene_type:complete